MGCTQFNDVNDVRFAIEIIKQVESLNNTHAGVYFATHKSQNLKSDIPRQGTTLNFFEIGGLLHCYFGYFCENL